MDEKLLECLQDMYDEGKLNLTSDYDEDDAWSELLGEKEENSFKIGGKFVNFEVYRKGNDLCIQI